MTPDRITLPFNMTSSVDHVKYSLDHIIKPFGGMVDNEKANRQYPLVKPALCEYVTKSHPTLNSIINVLSSDIVYNVFNFIKKDDPSYNPEELVAFWKRNRLECKRTVEEWLGFGYGAAEIIYDSDNDQYPSRLHQIPSKMLCIENVMYGRKIYHYAVYNNGGVEKRFRITREDYSGIPEQHDKSIGYVLWLGGGTDSDWYDMPRWSSAYIDILTCLKKKELDYNTITNNNIPKAALFIKGPPDNPADESESVYNSLKNQFQAADGGVAISYLETPFDTNELHTEYVQIQSDNYDYLNELIEQTDKILHKLYEIPEVRLAIDNNSESINSQKSRTEYEIYTLNLNDYQVPLEEECIKFTKLFWDIDIDLEIQTPIFTDTKQTQVETLVSLFDHGVWTLRDALTQLQDIYPDHDWSTTDFGNSELNQRFYHGMLFTTPVIETGMNTLTNGNTRGVEASEGLHDSTDNEESTPPRSLFGR